MSGWADLPVDVRELVERTLGPFPLQLEAWRLREMGRSWRVIAFVQDVGRRAVRDRVMAADVRLWKAGLRQDAYGRYWVDVA